MCSPVQLRSRGCQSPRGPRLREGQRCGELFPNAALPCICVQRVRRRASRGYGEGRGSKGIRGAGGFKLESAGERRNESDSFLTLSRPRHRGLVHRLSGLRKQARAFHCAGEETAECAALTEGPLSEPRRERSPATRTATPSSHPLGLP